MRSEHIADVHNTFFFVFFDECVHVFGAHKVPKSVATHNGILVFGGYLVFVVFGDSEKVFVGFFKNMVSNASSHVYALRLVFYVSVFSYGCPPALETPKLLFVVQIVFSCVERDLPRVSKNVAF